MHIPLHRHTSIHIVFLKYYLSEPNSVTFRVSYNVTVADPDVAYWVTGFSLTLTIA